jgi:AraC-like DNA-binding protein/ligand-binding sensor protein
MDRGMNRSRDVTLRLLKSGDADAPAGSALASLMELIAGQGPLDLSFEDLTGITYEHAELHLAAAQRYHAGPLCCWAKEHVRRPGGMATCALNKYLANRRVQAEGAPIVGLCHMGLTDLCRPLIYRQQLLGVFYYGSFVLAGHVEQVREHVLRVCRERLLSPDQALAALQGVPVLPSADIPTHERRLAELVRLALLILDGLALPADVLQPRQRAADARAAPPAVPQLVIDAMRMMAQHADQPLNLKSIAGRLRCHPAHLSRVFRAAMSTSVGSYLHRLRIERACKLLRSDRLDVTRIAYEVGFTDKSNFGRSFRRQMGTSPAEYRRRCGNGPDVRS